MQHPPLCQHPVPANNPGVRKNRSLLVQSRSGIALLTAMAALSLMLYISSEVSYDSLVEYSVNAQNLHRLRAYYAARNGVELSLFRIKLYQQVQNLLGGTVDQSMLDQVYKFPFAWPLPAPKEMNSIDKDDINKVVKESLMVGTYFTTIEDEGSRIDITSLGSNVKSLREGTKKQLMKLFENRLESDKVFKEKYESFNFDELINQIGDFMSSKSSSFNGGDKRAGYSDLGLKNFPPNRQFRTLEEMRFVPLMNEEFFQILAPNITIYGTKGINPNNATAQVIRSLDKGFTDEIVGELMKRRDDPEKADFKSADEFWDYMEGELKIRLEENEKEDIPLAFDAISSFRITSVGEFNGSKREIQAIVLNIESAASNLKTATDKAKAKEKDASGAPVPEPTPTPTPTPADGAPEKTKPKIKVEKGPPRIVFWYEK